MTVPDPTNQYSDVLSTFVDSLHAIEHHARAGDQHATAEAARRLLTNIDDPALQREIPPDSLARASAALRYVLSGTEHRHLVLRTFDLTAWEEFESWADSDGAFGDWVSRRARSDRFADMPWLPRVEPAPSVVARSSRALAALETYAHDRAGRVLPTAQDTERAQDVAASIEHERRTATMDAGSVHRARRGLALVHHGIELPDIGTLRHPIRFLGWQTEVNGAVVEGRVQFRARHDLLTEMANDGRYGVIAPFLTSPFRFDASRFTKLDTPEAIWRAAESLRTLPPQQLRRFDDIAGSIACTLRHSLDMPLPEGAAPRLEALVGLLAIGQPVDVESTPGRPATVREIAATPSLYDRVRNTAMNRLDLDTVESRNVPRLSPRLLDRTELARALDTVAASTRAHSLGATAARLGAAAAAAVQFTLDRQHLCGHEVSPQESTAIREFLHEFADHGATEQFPWPRITQHANPARDTVADGFIEATHGVRRTAVTADHRSIVDAVPPATVLPAPGHPVELA